MPDVDLNKRYRQNAHDLVLEGAEAVNEAIDNILSTRPGERAFNRGFGIGLWHLLFEPIGERTARQIESVIVHTLTDLEPRIQIGNGSVLVTPRPDENRYDVRITYRFVTGGSGLFQQRLERPAP